jgi:predicted  nucleic acid-binding Zn-ribbon protein
MVVALIVGLAPTSSATPGARLRHAHADLTELTGRISQEAATLNDLEGRVAAADRQIATAEHALGLVLGARLEIRDQVLAARVAYADAEQRLSDTVVNAFMASPGATADADVLGAFLDASSLLELQDQLAFGDAVATDRARSAAEVARAQAVLEARARALEGALAAQRATVESLREARDERVAALAAQQSALAELEGTRDGIVSLIDRLHDRLAAGDIGAVARAFQGADHVSYGDWANMLLRVVGAPGCRDNRVVVVAWQVQEFTQASWNPLATTHRMDGSTDFNPVGVQNYGSLEQGLQATKETIDHGWDVYGYGAIVRSLRACAPSLATAYAIAASSWCPGCLGGNYVVGVVPKVDADLETYSSL